MNRSRGHSLQNQTSSIWCVEGSSLPLLQDTLNGCETPRTDRPLPNPPKSSAVIKPSDVAILIRRLYQVRLSLKNDDVACGVNNYCLLSASLRTFVCTRASPVRKYGGKRGRKEHLSIFSAAILCGSHHLLIRNSFCFCITDAVSCKSSSLRCGR